MDQFSGTLPLIDETLTRDPDRARALNWATWTPAPADRPGMRPPTPSLTTEEIIERARAFLAFLRESD